MNLANEGRPETSEEPTQNPKLDPGILLLCEDSEDDEFWFKKTFKKAGLSASIVVMPTVRQAITFLKECCETGQNIPRLMVLDFRLADGRCTEVLEFIQVQAPLKGVPVLTYSGGLNKEDLESTQKYAVVASLEKPLTVEKMETFRPYLK
jgi:DNA-binding NtrC family response regulator